MPTYRYRCDRCGEQIDVRQSIHDDPLQVHNGECGGKLRKVLGVGGIVLKGSGFYRTDNRAAASKGGGGSKSDKADGNGSSSDGAKSDSKKPEPSSSSSKSDSPSKSGS